MGKCLLTGAAKRIVKEVYEYPNGVYSIHFKDETADVIWCNDKLDLYRKLQAMK